MQESRYLMRGRGGGFSSGSIQVNLERSGLILKSKEVYEADELFDLIKGALYPYGEKTIEEIDSTYKKRKWDE